MPQDFSLFPILSSQSTVETCNKEQVGKHRLIPYLKSVPYHKFQCENQMAQNSVLL